MPRVPKTCLLKLGIQLKYSNVPHLKCIHISVKIQTFIQEVNPVILKAKAATRLLHTTCEGSYVFRKVSHVS